MRAAAPTPAHQALVDQMHGVLDRFPSIPAVERLALLGQVVGHVIAELPADAGYSPQAVMHAISLNIASGNEQAARGLAGKMAALEGDAN